MITSPAGQQKQQGVALIVVMLIVALVAALGTEMGARLQLNVTRAINIKDNNQAYWYAMGAEQFAKKSIIQLLEANPEVISLANNWSEQFEFPLQGGGIQAQLSDMQSCFNINALRPDGRNNDTSAEGSKTNAASKSPTKTPPLPLGTLSEEAKAFKRLLELAAPELDEYSMEVATDSLVDWLDEDDRMSQNGAEDADYEALAHPYLAANVPLVSISELRLINGFSPKLIDAISPYVCAIPDSTEMKININTVTEENALILAALVGVSSADIQSILAARPEDGFQQVSDFTADPRIAAVQLTADQLAWLDVTTGYFRLRTKTHYNNASFMMSSVFKVDDNSVNVVKRDFGGAG